MSFYKEEALNGKLKLMNFEGAAVHVAEEHKNRIVHATLNFGKYYIMASIMPDQPVNCDNGNSISIAIAKIEEGEQYFNNLSGGGIMIMPYYYFFFGAQNLRLDR
ncbi:MAG: hypothetical protein R3E32_13110 [Chitinophagales bacterium]